MHTCMLRFDAGFYKYAVLKWCLVHVTVALDFLFPTLAFTSAFHFFLNPFYTLMTTCAFKTIPLHVTISQETANVNATQTLNFHLDGIK